MPLHEERRGPGGERRRGVAGPPFSAAADASATDNPRTTQRIDRQMNRNNKANRPYLSADKANGVIVSASTTIRDI
jgi:hypothetical protein